MYFVFLISPSDCSEDCDAGIPLPLNPQHHHFIHAHPRYQKGEITSNFRTVKVIIAGKTQFLLLTQFLLWFQILLLTQFGTNSSQFGKNSVIVPNSVIGPIWYKFCYWPNLVQILLLAQFGKNSAIGPIWYKFCYWPNLVKILLLAQFGKNSVIGPIW